VLAANELRRDKQESIPAEAILVMDSDDEVRRDLQLCRHLHRRR